jgi:signal transduction histidine kinase
MMVGDLTVESKLGKGSTFTVMWPVAIAEAST